jgi:hypothetical protein
VLVHSSKVNANYLVAKKFSIEAVFCASMSAAVLVYDSKVKVNCLVGKKFFIEFSSMAGGAPDIQKNTKMKHCKY